MTRAVAVYALFWGVMVGLMVVACGLAHAAGYPEAAEAFRATAVAIAIGGAVCTVGLAIVLACLRAGIEYGRAGAGTVRPGLDGAKPSRRRGSFPSGGL